MDEHKNSEEVEGRKILKPWADKHGIVKHSDLVDQLLDASTNSRNLPEEEKRWITHSMHFDCGMPFYKSDKFVGGASITPYQKIKQYLLEVQGRQQLVEANEHQIDILEIEIEEREDTYSKEEPNSYAARLLRIEISERERKLRQFKVNLRQSLRERNNYLRLIREFNESPSGKYKDGRLIIEVMEDEVISEELEKEHWTYRMAKQTALDWIAYGRPGIGNMDAVFMMDGEQQEEVMSLAIELYIRNEHRNKRLHDAVNKRIDEGLPPGKLIQHFEAAEGLLIETQERKRLEHVHTVQTSNSPTVTKHDPESR